MTEVVAAVPGHQEQRAVVAHVHQHRRSDGPVPRANDREHKSNDEDHDQRRNGVRKLCSVQCGKSNCRQDYRNKNAQSPPMRDPNPVVVLAPGIGLFALAKDKATARIAIS